MNVKNKNKKTFSIINLIEFIYENKVLSSIGTSLVALLIYFSEPLKLNVYNYLWPEKVEIQIDYDKNSVCSSCEFPISIKLMQASEGKIKSGILNISLINGLTLRDPAQQSIKIPEFSGTIDAHGSPIIIRADHTFKTNGMIDVSYKNPIFQATKKIIIINRISESNEPKIVSTDTNRVDLSGSWNINIGADTGEMVIKQDEKSKIHGIFHLNQMDGKVDGFKDGTTFRVFFIKDDNNESKIWIEGIFRRNKDDDKYIEIDGCAYGIKKDKNVNKATEGSKLDNCIYTKDFFGWRGISVSAFYATALLQSR